MLYCCYCDYHSVLSVHPGTDKIKTSRCEYAHCIFYRDVEDMDMEYPCNAQNMKLCEKSNHECTKITA